MSSKNSKTTSLERGSSSVQKKVFSGTAIKVNQDIKDIFVPLEQREFRNSKLQFRVSRNGSKGKEEEPLTSEAAKQKPVNGAMR